MDATGNFHSHLLAHVNISRKLQGILEESILLNKNGETAEGFRQLYEKVSELFALHDRMFDDPFIRQTES